MGEFLLGADFLGLYILHLSQQGEEVGCHIRYKSAKGGVCRVVNE